MEEARRGPKGRKETTARNKKKKDGAKDGERKAETQMIAAVVGKQVSQLR